MEKQKVNFFGVGPKIIRPTIAYGIAATLLTLFYPELFLMNFISGTAFHIIGGIFLGFGIAFIFISGPAMKRAVSLGRLETTGTFAIVRNPLYFAWIAFIFPGSAIASQAWLLFGMSAIAFYLFIKLIPQEEAMLEETFGEEFLTYKKAVPAIIPSFKNNPI
ncbi:Protein-S-isoprenylcysteine O-methyltransferase Ste14 [Maridesulfovibrio ferrireducens]|uniref:Protein-S-isoprenylcysteine O-methyltransferase Ste14 n=1 Tax=Maridesulfovibrio ferrireducens TaxID=246191 RepID=A0A1G9CYY8_9BACT|nr:isoprenylcysteine carboxylmethyltransferase family protein [Maridesulfovibrio ferrireducens]SDK56859.1 Protein-S-isoprenylcysteine O-methyltransferase Ste14 [Maridesulfovibrio ferrireducens]